jgi:hypothetical protein
VADVHRARWKRLAFDQGWLLGLVVFAVYLWLAPTWVVDGDNAEFATLGATGGAAHPSGYPLYVIYLRLMQWIPGASPAHTAAIATIFISAGSIVMLHAACRAWGARPTAASIACGLFAGGPIVLRMYTEAEVFALNGLAVATILWLAGPSGPVKGARRVIWLALVAGLGLSNHLSCVFTAPVGLYGVVVGLRELERRRVAVAAVAALAFVGGLTPYLYLLLAPHTPASWGRIDSLTSLVRHFLREDYGGPGNFGAKGDIIPALTSIGALVENTLRSWLWLPVAVGIGMLGVGVVRPGPRIGWACILAVIAIAGPLLVMRFNVPPRPGIELYVCQRFYLMPMLVLAVPIAVGLTRGVDWVIARRPVLALRGRVSHVLALAPLLLAIGLSLPHQRRAHSPAVERAIEMVIRTAPPNAVIYTYGDHYAFIGAYAQHGLGLRPDVVMISGGMFTMRWYVDDVERALGFKIPSGPELRTVRTVREVLAHGRPLLVDRKVAQQTLAALPSYPYGTLIRVLPEGAPLPSVDEVLAMNRDIFESVDLDYPRPHRTDDWSAQMHLEYATAWRTISEALRAHGKTEDADWAADLALALQPR